MSDSKTSTIKHGTLANGMKYALATVGCATTAMVSIFVDSGARHEIPDSHGVAHLAEHLFFRGTPTYPTKQLLLNPIYRYGGELNALTCHEYTMFYFKMPSMHVWTGMNIFLDMMSNARISSKDVKIETQAVLQERRQTQSSPSTQFQFKVHTSMFHNTPLNHNVAGNADHLIQVTLPMLYAYLDTCYVPENMCIVVSGQIDNMDKMASQLDATWGKWSRTPYGNLLTKNDEQDAYRQYVRQWQSMRPSASAQSIPTWPPIKPARLILSNRSSQHTMISMAFASYGKYSRDESVTDLIGSYLAGTIVSPLLQKLREEKGWVYSVSYNDAMYRDVGLVQFVCSTKPDVKIVTGTLKLIRDELDAIIANGIPDEKFEEIQDYVMNHVKMDVDDDVVGSWASLLGEQILFRRRFQWTFDDIANQVKTITNAQVKEVAKRIFSSSRMQIVLLTSNDNDREVFDGVQGWLKTL